MYNNEPKKDWFGAVITAGLGAGIVTSLAVGLGQDPIIAAAITLFAIGGALLIDQVL
ncbi:MAG: hypothetical protein AAF215_11505 [Cyanobacteria bacterium P01_A01_bin.123]